MQHPQRAAGPVPKVTRQPREAGGRETRIQTLAGVMTAGNLLLDAAARAGLYGLMVRTSGPQIRGGEAAALLRLGARPVAT